MTNKITQYHLLRNLAFFFMLGFLVYYLFRFPPIVWRLGLVGVCVIGFFMHLSQYRFVAVEKSMLLFVLLVSIHFLLSFIWRKPILTNYGNVLCSLLPIPLFFFLAAKGTVSQRALTEFLILSCIAGFFYFSHAESILLERVAYGESGEVTNNASTVFLVIIPLLFFVRKKWIIVIVSMIIIFFIIYGAKRGNIVSVVPPFYLLARMFMKKKKTVINELLLILVVLAFALFAYYLTMNNEYMLSRIDRTLEGDTSNRTTIYRAALLSWLNAPSFINLIFGYGADGTLSQIGIRAHNDWLEILVDYGIIGVVVYSSFMICLLRAAIRNKKNPQLFYALLSVFYIWFSKSIYSMGFTNDIFSFLSVMIGVILGLEYRQREGKPVFSDN